MNPWTNFLSKCKIGFLDFKIYQIKKRPLPANRNIGKILPVNRRPNFCTPCEKKLTISCYLAHTMLRRFLIQREIEKQKRQKLGIWPIGINFFRTQSRQGWTFWAQYTTFWPQISQKRGTMPFLKNSKIAKTPLKTKLWSSMKSISPEQILAQNTEKTKSGTI